MLTTPVGSKCRYVVFKQFNKICFLRETTFSEFDVDLILVLFIESYFILQCTFFFLEKSKKTWWSLDQSMGQPMGELRFCLHPDI